MLNAASRAIRQLTDPALFRVVLLSVLGTIAAFAAIWLGIGALLAHVRLFDNHWLDWLARFAVGIGAVFATVALFGSVAAVFAGFVVERIARAVERRYYPGLPPPRRQSGLEQIRAGLSFLGATVVINLLASPLYLIWGVDLPIFLVVNGYLLGREYFELVALRRTDRVNVARLRRDYAGHLLLAGAMIAALSFLPLANLLTPVLATAFMLHVLQGLPPSAVR